MIIEMLSRASLQTFDCLRCTSKYFEKLTYKKNFLNLYKRRNNVVFGVIFIPSCGGKNFDIGCLTNSCTILASSLCGLIVGEVCYGSYEFEAVAFQDHLIIIHSVIYIIFVYFITDMYFLCSDLLKDQVDYDYFHLELFDSTTWQWGELCNIRLPSSVYPVSDEAIITGGVFYFLLSNHDILRFDVYLEEYLVIFAPSVINDFNSYASRLIKFDGKLGCFSISRGHLWAIWAFIQNW
uniref:F-box associated domain-containing protein n=1 Tax=Lactuca sativa TaxID=4236 RepID=A0A9R1WSK9_LACSA|nr:hypothetical protein LSAT_V11C100042800 [Lactuca sativa]